MFGNVTPPQNENTPFHPRSPYAAAKLYAYWMARNYRDGYNLFSSNGILFNHESPRRGETFVTRKVTRALADILAGKQKTLYLGNLQAKRDWGYAPEYVEGMWRILQQPGPGDFVLGTGQSHSVKEFVDIAFRYSGIRISWKGKGEKEIGIAASENGAVKKGQIVIKIDPRYFRPTEVENLIADTAKAKKELGWKPKLSFAELVKVMTDADIRLAGLDPVGEGDEILIRKFPGKWWKGD
jgi:GDPmannose 4,6-dehydratase